MNLGLSSDGAQRPLCGGCGYVHYHDPKVAAGAIVRDDVDRILMIQRDIEPGLGLWTFPGGYVDRFEEPTLAAKREIREETGVEIELLELQGIYRAQGSAVLLLVYLATLRDDSPPARALEECRDCRFFSTSEIPWGQLAFPTTKAALDDVLAKRSARTSHSAVSSKRPQRGE